jgi:hypothetical protein
VFLRRDRLKYLMKSLLYRQVLSIIEPIDIGKGLLFMSPGFRHLKEPQLYHYVFLLLESVRETVISSCMSETGQIEIYEGTSVMSLCFSATRL